MKYFKFFFSVLLISQTVVFASLSERKQNEEFIYGSIKNNITIRSSDIGRVQTFSLEIPVYRKINFYAEEPKTCNMISCDRGYTPILSEPFLSLYRALPSEKPRVLSSLVKGLSVSIAARILEAGFFKSPTENWQAFAKEIQSAQYILDHAGISEDFQFQVLYLNGKENALRLGLYSDVACVSTPFACKEFVLKTRTEFAYNQKTELRIYTSGSLLQYFETDHLMIQISKQGAQILSQDGVNRYQIIRFTESTPFVFEVYFSGDRITQYISNFARHNLNQMGQDLSYQINLPQEHLPTSEPGSEVQVYYEVCLAAWIGSCKTVVRQMQKVVVNKSVMDITIRGPFINDEKYYVRGKIARVGSRFYSGTFHDFNTSSVKFR